MHLSIKFSVLVSFLMQAVMYNVPLGLHAHFANIPVAPSSYAACWIFQTYRTTSLASSLQFKFPRECVHLAQHCELIVVHRSRALVTVPNQVRLLSFRQPDDMPQICDEVSDSFQLLQRVILVGMAGF